MDSEYLNQIRQRLKDKSDLGLVIVGPDGQQTNYTWQGVTELLLSEMKFLEARLRLHEGVLDVL